MRFECLITSFATCALVLGSAGHEADDPAVTARPPGEETVVDYYNGLPVFSADGRLLAVKGYTYGGITVWDLNRREATHELSGQTPECMAFSADGALLAAGGSDGDKVGEPGWVDVWDLKTGRIQVSFTGHAGRVMAVAFHPEGRLLVSSSLDHTLRVWELKTNKQVDCVKTPHEILSAVAFIPDGSRLAATADGSVIHLLDTKSWKITGTIKDDQQKSCVRLRFSPDGKLLACCGVPNTSLFNVATAERVQVLSDAPIRYMHDDFFDVAFSGDGKEVASADPINGFVVRETSSGKLLRQEHSDEYMIRNCHYSLATRKWLAGGWRNTRLCIWQLSAEKRPKSSGAPTGK